MWIAALLVAWALALVGAVRPGDFKRCEDSSVCRRFRGIAGSVEGAPQPFSSPYSVPVAPVGDAGISFSDARLEFPVRSALHPDTEFTMWATFFADGAARVQMDQSGDTYKGWRRYDAAAQWAVVHMPARAQHADVSWDAARRETTVRWGDTAGPNEFVLQHEPLRIVFRRDGVEQMVLNGRSLLHMEHFRAKPDGFPTRHGGDDADAEDRRAVQQRADALKAQHQRRTTRSRAPTAREIEQWAAFEMEDSGEWEETWSGVKDTKPKGPEGVALDVTFPGYGTLYGLPEHASPLSLRSTRSPPGGEPDEPDRFSDPYRLMNTDVFEYEHDSPMSLYGSSPILHAQSRGSAVSVLWMNAAETWVDLHKTRTPAAVRRAGDGPSHEPPFLRGGTSEKTSHAHFFSETGVMDVFVFLGPSASWNMERFTALVGRTALPQYFALGYHQCRWNYLSDEDVKDVSRGFDDAKMPADVIWLDIEYSKDHMYGVWDKNTFPDPESMVQALDERGRKLVIIIDPHLKATDEYFLYEEAKKEGLLVKSRDGQHDYEGECWSGHASWIDVFHPRTWAWWSDQFYLLRQKLKANARNVFVWNDMSEPAIFDGPEVTSPKDVIHHGGWENRDVHNINGVIYHNLTARGLTRRELGTRDRDGRPGVERRPFVLSRAWWLGTQRFGAVWTGDNMGTWEHFAGSVPMILANGLGGMSFCGADIGGFFGDPDEELLVRWYQAGIFEPFFRAHAHIDTRRREPFLFDGPTQSALRGLLQLRYQLLPLWYTAFWQSSESGLPVLRTQHLVFPLDERGFAIGDQYYLGDSGLLVKPAVTQGATSVEMYLADAQVHYSYFSRHVYRGATDGRYVTVPAPLTEELPLLVRGGSILPVRMRNRRAAELQARDPFTLRVAVNSAAHGIRATGMLYLDDGQTFAYRDAGAFIARHFVLTQQGASFTLAASALSLREAHAGDSTTALQRVDNAFAQEIAHVRVERIVIVGLAQRPVRVVAHKRGAPVELPFDWTPAARRAPTPSDSSELVASELVIRDPAVAMAEDWSVVVE
ncbi:glucan 1,3-alpha-glucosidase [Malassezia sp. CBS 17886]|nr:glucan 1,3-alpha-glucosidase [Malassezia sp. CBS 17886]